MQLRTKIHLNNSLLTGLLLVSSATSFMALGTQTETTRFLAEDARQTSQAIAAADKAIGTQLLAVEHSLHGLADAADLQTITAAGADVDTALQQLALSSLVESAGLQTLRSSALSFRTSLADLLATHGKVTATKQALGSHTVGFNELSTVMEEVGDSAVEVLEKSPDQPMTWGHGLKDVWEAADGGWTSLRIACCSPVGSLIVRIDEKIASFRKLR